MLKKIIFVLILGFNLNLTSNHLNLGQSIQIVCNAVSNNLNYLQTQEARAPDYSPPGTPKDFESLEVAQTREPIDDSYVVEVERNVQFFSNQQIIELACRIQKNRQFLFKGKSSLSNFFRKILNSSDFPHAILVIYTEYFIQKGIFSGDEYSGKIDCINAVLGNLEKKPEIDYESLKNYINAIKNNGPEAKKQISNINDESMSFFVYLKYYEEFLKKDYKEYVQIAIIVACIFITIISIVILAYNFYLADSIKNKESPPLSSGEVLVKLYESAKESAKSALPTDVVSSKVSSVSLASNSTPAPTSESISKIVTEMIFGLCK